VRSPARRTAMPSAMVFAEFSVTGLPAATAAFIDAMREGCTPNIFTAEFVSLTAHAMPPDQDLPPAIGATTASISGCCCRISSPSVPCPAMTASSFERMNQGQPIPLERFQPPYRRLRRNFAPMQDDVRSIGASGRHFSSNGVGSGMKMRAFTPWRPA